MAIEVKSPYSGRPVRVRSQDVGRALRDEAGRVFYVVPRAGGGGYYAAPTRGGSEKDEAAYDALPAAPPPEAGDAAVHDTTGSGRGRGPRVALIVVLVLVLLALAGYLVWGPEPGPALPPIDPEPPEIIDLPQRDVQSRGRVRGTQRWLAAGALPEPAHAAALRPAGAVGILSA